MRRIMILLLIAIVAVGAIGYYRGWFTIASRNEGGQTRINLTVDQTKFNEDVEKARQTAKQATGENTVKGKVTAVKLTGISVTLHEGKPIEIEVNKETVITRNGKRISLPELNVGETVDIVLVQEEDMMVARRITVLIL